MPLYEYKCEKCDGVFEVIQKFVDAPLTEHEGCGGAVNRLISSSALMFKGSGWYVTDYAKGNGKSTSESNKANADKGDSKGDSKSTSKSDSSSTSSPSSTPAPSSDSK